MYGHGYYSVCGYFIFLCRYMPIFSVLYYRYLYGTDDGPQKKGEPAALRYLKSKLEHNIRQFFQPEYVSYMWLIQKLINISTNIPNIVTC